MTEAVEFRRNRRAAWETGTIADGYKSTALRQWVRNANGQLCFVLASNVRALASLDPATFFQTQTEIGATDANSPY